MKGNDVSSGLVMSDYVGSGPPKGTGNRMHFNVLCDQHHPAEARNITTSLSQLRSSQVRVAGVWAAR